MQGTRRLSALGIDVFTTGAATLMDLVYEIVERTLIGRGQIVPALIYSLSASARCAAGFR